MEFHKFGFLLINKMWSSALNDEVVVIDEEVPDSIPSFVLGFFL